MKKTAFLLFSLLFVNLTIAQELAIKIINQSSKKEFVIKENKRVKIKTVDGEKISGHFVIKDNLIMIQNKEFAISDIQEIKRNPLLTSILTSSFLIYGGALAVGFGVLIGVLADSAAFWLTLPGAGMIYTGIKSPNFNRKFKNDGSWTFEIITLSD